MTITIKSEEKNNETFKSIEISIAKNLGQLLNVRNTTITHCILNKWWCFKKMRPLLTAGLDSDILNLGKVNFVIKVI